jgi:hypothetical protein
MEEHIQISEADQGVDSAVAQSEESRIIEEQAAFLAGVAGFSPKQRYEHRTHEIEYLRFSL